MLVEVRADAGRGEQGLMLFGGDASIDLAIAPFEGDVQLAGCSVMADVGDAGGFDRTIFNHRRASDACEAGGG